MFSFLASICNKNTYRRPRDIIKWQTLSLDSEEFYLGTNTFRIFYVNQTNKDVEYH